MRIISKFQDYYDSVQRQGMDKEVVYVRENKIIDVQESFGIDFTTKDPVGSSNGGYTIHTMFLGYCGSIYKIFMVESAKWRYSFYEYEEFKAFMIHNNLGSSYDFRDRKWWPSKYQRFNNFDTSKLVELFHRFQTPLFLLNHERSYRAPNKSVITLGPCLKDLEFYTRKDSYTAYQDIFQYVAGVLNHPENKMVKISDKDKIHKHGFDKWSFRQKGPKK